LNCPRLKSSASYVGIGILDDLFLEVGCLLGMYESRAENPRCSSTLNRYHDVHSRLLRERDLRSQPDSSVIDDAFESRDFHFHLTAAQSSSRRVQW